ncbi:hypothetical protein SAMN05428642_101565 [Flaviramulus basaltis]|uniref:Uncharacterized protein n=1 Tax=Flaviramulus basaltis TaxID=369401 RepID=A0A1K2IBM7_9FLAO|nr:hypothetical protein [Flaviramulus basaltis]SFZ89793.1 hypothetical protein SAMN05428642_101565 [Flaviramulus basaltis]
MKDKSLFIILFILFSVKIVSSQSTYDIVFSDSDRKQNCKECLKTYSKKPVEVKFSIIRQNKTLYFEINDKHWFDLLFQNQDDGLAIDIVSKDRYDCKLEEIEKTQIKGYLLKPIYSEALKKGLKSKGDNIYSVNVGEVPVSLLNKDLEYNILFLGNKNLCLYNVLYDLDSYESDLLDMGMYLDSLTYSTKKIKSIKNEGDFIRRKTLKFVIPFKKNKSEYSQADIKPIYDSLKLTDFNIKAINIKAYSSIEGIESRNIELQKLRGKSIVAALQSFQKPTIETNVSSLENWVELFNDIENTPYKYLSLLTKNEIKEKIAGSISKQMEPIFKNHRKAVVELELVKKDKYSSEMADVLLKRFNSAIEVYNLENAKEIQNSIFEKLKFEETSLHILQKMEIPKKEIFAKIMNKNAAFRYMLDERQALVSYNELLEIEKLVPKAGEIKYNLVAVKIKLWSSNAIDIDDVELLREINLLKKYDIDKSLILKMIVNFHMIICEKFMKNRDFDNKDKSVELINKSYKKLTLTDYDYLSLAQFFSYYSNDKLAIDLLESKARSIDIDEDLLFYYLNLTIINKQLTKDPNYRTVMLNAINVNAERFCKLFNYIDAGGVTFQLLEDEYLRETYCESCQ